MPSNQNLPLDLKRLYLQTSFPNWLADNIPRNQVNPLMVICRTPQEIPEELFHFPKATARQYCVCHEVNRDGTWDWSNESEPTHHEERRDLPTLKMITDLLHQGSTLDPPKPRTCHSDTQVGKCPSLLRNPKFGKDHLLHLGLRSEAKYDSTLCRLTS